MLLGFKDVKMEKYVLGAIIIIVQRMWELIENTFNNANYMKSEYSRNNSSIYEHASCFVLDHFCAFSLCKQS